MPNGRAFSRTRLLALVAVLAAGAIVLTRPLAWHASSQLPIELRDPLHDSWTLAWVADHLRHGLTGVWDAPFLYPYRSTLAFGEHFFGVAVFVAPLYWITHNPVLLYNVALLGSFLLAGVGMYICVVELTGEASAALVAAALYAFCPYRFANVAHLQNLFTGWMPLSLAGLHHYFRTGSRRALVGATAAYLLLGLSNGYFLVFFAIVLLVVSAWLLWSSARSRTAFRDLLIAGLAIAAAYAPVASVYLHVRARYGFVRTVEDNARFSADVGSYLNEAPALRGRVPVGLHAYTKPAGPLEAHDSRLFPGFTMVALAVVGLVGAWRDRAVRLYAAIALLGLVLSLGPAPTAWGYALPLGAPYTFLLRYVPGFDALRTPARFAVVVHLGLTIVAAFGAARLLRARTPRRAALASAALVFVAIWESSGGAIPLVAVGPRGRTPDQGLYTFLARQPPGAVLELPIGSLDADYRGFVYQYNTLVHRHRLVNGWSGYNTPVQVLLGGPASPLRDGADVAGALALMRGVGVSYLVVHPDDFQDRTLGKQLLDGVAACRMDWSESLSFGSATLFVLRPSVEQQALDVRRVDPARIHARASTSEHRLASLFDGSLDTRWFSAAQAGGEWIALSFDRALDVGVLRFEMHPRSFGDYPRGLAITSIGPRREQPLYRGPFLEALGVGLRRDPAHPIVDFALPPNETTTLRLEQTGRTDGLWHWSVDDLSVWERVPHK